MQGIRELKRGAVEPEIFECVTANRGNALFKNQSSDSLAFPRGGIFPAVIPHIAGTGDGQGAVLQLPGQVFAAIALLPDRNIRLGAILEDETVGTGVGFRRRAGDAQNPEAGYGIAVKETDAHRFHRSYRGRDGDLRQICGADRVRVQLPQRLRKQQGLQIIQMGHGFSCNYLRAIGNLIKAAFPFVGIGQQRRTVLCKQHTVLCRIVRVCFTDLYFLQQIQIAQRKPLYQILEVALCADQQCFQIRIAAEGQQYIHIHGLN